MEVEVNDYHVSRSNLDRALVLVQPDRQLLGTLYTVVKFVLKFLYCLGKGKSKSKGEGKGEGQGHCQGHGQGSRVRVRLSRSGSICGVVRVKVGVAVIGYWLLLLL